MHFFLSVYNDYVLTSADLADTAATDNKVTNICQAFIVPMLLCCGLEQQMFSVEDIFEK